MSRELKITQLDQIPPASTDWVWDQRIPEGELTLLAGREGGGKSTIAYELAAQLSRGDLAGDFYDQPSGTIIVATEDALDRTIVPRLMAAKADLTQVVQVTVQVTVEDEEEYKDEVTLPIDLVLLHDAIQERNVRLIILDPLLSRLDIRLDTHKDAEVRKALEPLVELAHECECSVLGIIHVNKGSGTDALSRIMGSRAFTAVARSVLYVIEDPEDEDVQVIGRPKSNLGGNAPSQSFRIVTEVVGFDEKKQKDVTAGRIEWGEELDESINALLKQTESKGPKGPKPDRLEEAKEWLHDQLTDTPMMSDAYKVWAKADGISEATLKRAANAMGVKVTKSGRLTYWQLPDESPPMAIDLSSVEQD